ncbi:alpha-2C adrenergic receptor-like [Mytilus californianus]|uniref:alpha-2C adrenergic receptor-like n=1 Tax=Mytilus californianus TaxID=6549 RepID=UPI00224544F2|nr:alpha-2C adrenergic receptor-like [Mytilus californianus]
MNNSSYTKNITNIDLEILNSAEAIRRLPVIMFILILIIIGVFGNLHVFYIYITKFGSSTYRMFVLSLASVDILSCCMSMPFEMADELNPYIFNSEITCKIFRFLNTCLAMITALMLVVIASERYRRICKPYGNQMSEKHARYALIGVVLFAIIATMPALYVYGIKTLHLKVSGQMIKGSECTWSDEVAGSVIGYAYYAWGLLVILVCMFLLVILYSLVGLHLRRHTIKIQSTIRLKHRRRKSTIRRSVLGSLKIRRKSRQIRSADSKALQNQGDKIKINARHSAPIHLTKSTDNKPSIRRKSTFNVLDPLQMNTIEMLSFTQNDFLTIQPFCENVKTSLHDTGDTECSSTASFDIKIDGKGDNSEEGKINQTLCDSYKDIQQIGVGVDKCQTPDENKITDPNSTYEMKTLPKRGTIMRKTKTFISDREQRITKVLFTITLLFIFSFLPYIIILIVYSANPSYEENLTSTPLYPIYLIGLRLYLINNVANSLLYISFDLKFRKQG